MKSYHLNINKIFPRWIKIIFENEKTGRDAEIIT